jgi:hypothetical protein
LRTMATRTYKEISPTALQRSRLLLSSSSEPRAVGRKGFLRDLATGGSECDWSKKLFSRHWFGRRPES